SATTGGGLDRFVPIASRPAPRLRRSRTERAALRSPAMSHSLPLHAAVAALLLAFPSCTTDAASTGTPATDAPDAPSPSDAAPIALFDGVSLAGWHTDVPAADGGVEVPPSFTVRDGLLVSNGSPEGHLITDESFRDYRLVVE